MRTNSSPKMLILAAVAAISMGTIGVISRLSGLDAATVTFFRLTIGGSLLLVMLLMTGQIEKIKVKPHPLMVINGAMLAGFMTLFIASLSYTSMLIAVMALYLAPAVATVAAHFLLNEKLTTYSIISVLSVLLGFALVIYQPNPIDTTETSWQGLALAIGGMICYASFILINRKIPSHYHEFSKCSWQFLIGTLCVAPLLINTELSLTFEQWGWMLLVGLLPGFLGIVLAVYTLKHLPAATFGTISYIEPISAVILGWIVFAEVLSPLQLFGCTVIIAASMAQGIKPRNQSATTGLNIRNNN
ncbi:EamA family transporter [Vibrio sp. FNV 38]|nr:EamA family transporter [Vibrio sp. FNV 38]